MSDMTLHPGERECPRQEGRHDHVAEVAMTGTAIATFAQSPRADGPTPLTILHLNAAPVLGADMRPDKAPPPEARPDSEGGLADRLASAWAARSVARSTVSLRDPAGIQKKAD
jgi:hypothetical protein